MTSRNVYWPVTVALALLLALASAPAASAEPNPLWPDKNTCGFATCTAYWSVSRTRELQAEWKDTVTNSADTGAAAGAVYAAAKKLKGTGLVGAVVSFALLARKTEFEHMLNGAANDNRCLTLKYTIAPGPGGARPPAWFGSVSPNNQNCGT